MKKTRKILSLMLTVAMVFSLLGVNAFAAEQDIPAAEETEFAQALPEEAVQESALFENQAEEEPALSETEEESAPSEGLSEDELAFPGKTEEESVLPEVPAEEEPAQQEEAEEEFFLVEEPAEEELTLFEETEEAEVQAANALGSGTCGDNLTWTLSDAGVLTISGSGAMTDWTGDSAVPWHSYQTSIKTVNISGATSIGKYAFYGCSALTSVSVPATITSIGYMAFFECTSLPSIYIPSSVTSIGTYAFTKCSALTEITVHLSNTVYSSLEGVLLNKDNTQVICCPAGKSGSYTLPASVTTIGADAFHSCALTGITLQEGLTTIGNEAFIYCTGLTSVTIPRSVTSVGYRAFAYDDHLTSVSFLGSVPTFKLSGSSYDVFKDVTATAYYPGGDATWTEDVRIGYGGTLTWVEVIYGQCGDDVYWKLEGNKLTISGTGPMWDYTSGNSPWYMYRSSITAAVIEPGVTTIGEDAFEDCTSLASMTIPDSVTTIKFGAFDYCAALTSVTIPGSVTSIGQWAFSRCKALTSVTIPDGVTRIRAYTFAYCTALTSITIPDSVTTIGEDAFSSCTALTSVTIPDSVTTIGEGAFDYCAALTSVTIPGSVTAVGAGAFLNCDLLSSITVAPGNTKYTSIDGVLFTADQKTLHTYPTGRSGNSYAIPSSVTDIGAYAFDSCYSLESITIPDSVTTIGEDAFRGCTALTSMTIPDSVTTIGAGAFAFCEALTSVTIPDSVTTIGRVAFTYCEALTSVTIPDSVTTIGEDAFHSCTALTSITFEGSAPSFGSDVFYDVTATATYLPVESFGWTSDVMQDYGGTLTWVCDNKCGDDVTWYLGADGKLTLSGTGETWDFEYDYPGFYDFKDEIKSAVIENGVTGIGKGAFFWCSSMTNISLADSVISIGKGAFWACISLESITLPPGVTSIGEYAFDYCSALTSIDIPGSVTSIGKGAFYSCSSLTSITFEGSAPTFGEDVFEEVTATAYYPALDPTWTESVRQNYGGTITWKVIPVDLSTCTIASLPTKTYTGKAIKPAPTVTLGSTPLVKDTDYTVSYKNNTNAGTATVTITGIGNYTGTATATFKIKAKAITPTVKLSATSYTWNGKAKKPTVTVKNGSTTLAASNYKVTYASGRKNVGVYKVTVKMKGNYSGSKTVSFKINPKGTTISTLTAASKAITVKWKKQATKMSTARITGYQIQFATDSKFTKNKKLVPVSGYSKVSKKVTGLKGGKKYYVRIRTYKTISGKKYYSSWSKAKTVTTKK